MAKHQNYWFETHSTTSPIRSGLIRNADIIVIGGGIAGLLTLGQLLLSGIDNVYLLEESIPGYRASGRSSGQLMLRGGRSFTDVHHMIGEESAKQYANFLAANNEIMRTSINNYGFECDLHESGGLWLAIDEAEMVALTEEAQIIEKANVGVTPVVLNKEEIAGIIYSKRFFGGVYIPGEALFNPYKFTCHVAEEINSTGRRVLTDCSVTDVRRRDDGLLEVHVRNKGIIKTKQVIYCTNAYSPQLLPELKDFLVPVRGQMIVSGPMQEAVQTVMPPMSMSCNYGREYFHIHGGNMLMGGMRSKVRGHQRGITYDGEASRSVGQHLKDFMMEVFPYIKAPPTYTWTGIMAETKDGFPLVGALPNRPNEFICAGFNGYGFSHALLSAYVIRDILLYGSSQLPAAYLFDPARIEQN